MIPTSNDILSAIREAMSTNPVRPDGAFLVVELAERLHWGENRVREAIKKMLRNGTAELVSVVAIRMDGKPQTTSGYRIIRPVRRAAKR